MPKLKKKRAETRAARSTLPFWWRSLRLILPLLSLMLCAAGGLWLFHIGWPQREWRLAKIYSLAASQRGGFVVAQVYVTGRKEVSQATLLSALKVKRGDSLLAFDPAAARAALESIPWIAMARVERKWPDTINVFITERIPYARWQIDGHSKLVDRAGVVLSETVPADDADLPLIVGQGAPEAADSFFAMLARWPLFAKNLRSAVRIGDRRWDLHLSAAGLAQASPAATAGPDATRPGPEDELVVRLPSDLRQAGAALASLEAYGETSDLFLRPLVMIDVRLPDRLILRPRQTGANKILEAPGKTDKKVIIEPEDNDSGVDEDPNNPI